MLPAKKITLLICLMLAIAPRCLYAQYNTKQNKVWIFGRNAGIDFTSGSPVSISSDIFTDEGSASLADTAGNLLFYSDGDNVWNRNNAIMPNGGTLAPFSCLSSTQAAVIAPVTGEPKKYYLFSLEHILSVGRLAYSIVDMELDGGLGDVMPTAKGILIDSGFAEKMLVVRGDCNMWLIVHKVDTAKFYAYKITAAGIDTTPVISKVGTYVDYSGYGAIKISPDRSRLALTHYELSASGLSRLELFDFNASTGIVSDCRVLNTYSFPYGADFSPDNSKLYVHHWTHGKILQYDVSLPTTAAIIASEYEVAGSLNIGSDVKLGPDDKIYFSYDHGYLSRINAPNLAGSACDYTANAVSLSPGLCILGLPAVYWSDTTCPSTAVHQAPEVHTGISVYPNPAIDHLTVTLPDGGGVSELQILDMLGRVRVAATELNGGLISLSVGDLPQGNYIVRVSSNGGIYRSAITIAARGR